MTINNKDFKVNNLEDLKKALLTFSKNSDKIIQCFEEEFDLILKLGYDELLEKVKKRQVYISNSKSKDVELSEEYFPHRFLNIHLDEYGFLSAKAIYGTKDKPFNF